MVITDEPRGGFDRLTEAKQNEIRVLAGVEFSRRGRPKATAGKLIYFVNVVLIIKNIHPLQLVHSAWENTLASRTVAWTTPTQHSRSSIEHYAGRAKKAIQLRWRSLPIRRGPMWSITIVSLMLIWAGKFELSTTIDGAVMQLH